MKSVEYFIAQRYLVSKRSLRFINVIGLVSIIGITIGVAALVIVLSVFNGFNSVVTEVLVSFDPHLRIEKRGTYSEEEINVIQQEVTKQKNLTGCSKFVSGKAMVLAGNRNKVVIVRGIEQEKISQVSGLGDKLVLGSLLFQDTSGIQGIIIGLTLADKLGKVTGDEIQMISPQGFLSSLTSVVPPQAMSFRIMGIYESNNKDYDANYAFISLESAQQLFAQEHRYHGLEIRLNDFHTAEETKKEFLQRLPRDVQISTWYDLHKSLYNVMNIERWSAYFLISLIILVATFNLLGALTMGVIEKRRDIGVLKSMGLSMRRIIRLFMTEGIIIGIIGTVVGIVIGLLVLYLQIKYVLFPLDPTIYIIPAIPVKILWTDFIAVAVSSLGLSFLASYYPARRAALTAPAESIRWE